VFKVLSFVAVCAIVVFSTQSLVLLGLVDLVLELAFEVLVVLSEVGLHVPVVPEDVLFDLVLEAHELIEILSLNLDRWMMLCPADAGDVHSRSGSRGEDGWPLLATLLEGLACPLYRL
jgi:hypothetical protein